MSGQDPPDSSTSEEEEEEEEGEEETTPMKLAVVARLDLGMSPGKLAVQVGHGVHVAITKSTGEQVAAWDADGASIVVLEVQSFQDLKLLRALARKRGVRAHSVRDEGLTEVQSGAWTVLAVGPDESSRVDEVTGKLRLYGGSAEKAPDRQEGERGARCAAAEELA
mmetsp:Transcript_63073/g.126421  ORF Transcript_63073/g.126421 Transcript_63073/m.126421 type:complete len:166 (-) Transcript_63073:173-670(-)